MSPLLAVCGSLKPAPGRAEPSACRELLKQALAPVMSLYPAIEMLDLREVRLPPFDGRGPSEYGNADLVAVRHAVEDAAGYLFSVPAYWGGIGAAFKNFVETVCGPGYDGGCSPFAKKPGAVMIVGADNSTARAAVPQIEAIFTALGITSVSGPVVVGDPGMLVDVEHAVLEMTAAAASVVLALPAMLAATRAANR